MFLKNQTKPLYMYFILMYINKKEIKFKDRIPFDLKLRFITYYIFFKAN